MFDEERERNGTILFIDESDHIDKGCDGIRYLVNVNLRQKLRIEDIIIILQRVIRYICGFK